MSLNKKLFIILALVTAFTAACSNSYKTAKQLDCYVQELHCSPAPWKGVPFDTSIQSAEKNGFYRKIEPVNDINTPSNEWQLSFISPNRAIFTYDDSKLQKMLIARMVLPNRFTPEEGVSTPFSNHAGAISISGKKAVFAAVPIENHPPEELKNIKRYDQDSLVIGEYQALPMKYLIGQSRIFTANIKDNILSDVKEVKKTENFNTLNWESQPAFAFGSKVIFYSADIEGGYGGVDIWYKYEEAGSWSAPVNAGPNINTPCDELTPFVSSDGKILYFSSLGHSSVGGYDLFKSEIPSSFAKEFGKQAFGEAKNLGAPLNTASDELFPSCPGNCDSIFFYSSNQAAEGNMVSKNGGFDIYVMHKVVPEKLKKGAGREERKPDIAIELKPDLVNPEFTLEGTVFDENTGKPATSAEISIEENDKPYKKIETGDGGYSVKLKKGEDYELTAQKEDSFYDTYKVNVPRGDTLTKMRKDFYLPEVMSLRINFEFDKWEDPYRYTLDSNGIETSVTWSEELDNLAQNLLKSSNKIKKVILVGHTDEKGSNDYNLKLGEKRVDFVVNELVKRGVRRNILEGRSAGESERLPRRAEEPDSIYDKRLRRVTLEKVLENK